MVSNTKTLAADPASFEVGPPWTKSVGPAHPIDAQSDLDLENLEAKATH